MVFWSLLCYKELKVTINPVTECTLCGLLIQIQNISLRSLGICRKQNFEITFGFKSDTVHSLDFYFSLSLLPSFFFSLFLPHLFSFAKHLVGFVLVGKAFRKAFRILELDKEKVPVGG